MLEFSLLTSIALLSILYSNKTKTKSFKQYRNRFLLMTFRNHFATSRV